jgi:large subunit ribosomal protein L13
MSTFLPKAQDIKRDWYLIDAAGKPLGRTAALAATLLRGKQKTIFVPNVDCGDHVIIINAAQAVLTGNKLQKKLYRHHSGWVGGLKEVKYASLMKNNLKSDDACG